MDATSLHRIAEWSCGALIQGDPSQTVARICTDSRALQPGDLFIALRGENFDGHAFVRQAAELGAAAAVVDEAFAETLPENFGLIRVSDTLSALQSLASAYRASLTRLRVIGITGSSGKTSTKDFTAAVLGERYRVVKTEGNFNNHIGLPLTMLRASAEDEIGVFEMGMNHPGEIAPLAAMAAPEAGIVTNVGVAHIEFMGSREAIALEKGRLAEALPAHGTLALKASDDFSDSIAARTLAKTVLAGVGTGQLRAFNLEEGFEGSRFTIENTRTGELAEAFLPVPGIHMVENALLATAACLSMGVTLAEAVAGLAKCHITKGRMEQKTLGGIHFLDDSYNANPDSMRAALRTLATMRTSGARIAVLGRMGELGAESDNGHRSVGQAAAEAKLDRLIVAGAEAAPIAEAALARGMSANAVHQTADADAAAALLAHFARPGDVVLVKGSRSARMERILRHPAFTAPPSARTT